MAHPTFALARHPQPGPVGENPDHDPVPDLAALRRQVRHQVDALQQACRAAACMGKLIDDRPLTPLEREDARALLCVIGAEYERRMQAALATVEAMQAIERSGLRAQAPAWNC